MMLFYHCKIDCKGDSMGVIKENIKNIRNLIENSDDFIKSTMSMQDGISFLVKYIGTNLNLNGMKVLKFFKNQSFFKIYTCWDSHSDYIFGEQKTFFSCSADEHWLKFLNAGETFISAGDMLGIERDEDSDKYSYILIPVNREGPCKAFIQLKFLSERSEIFEWEEITNVLKEFAVVIDKFFREGVPDLKRKVEALDCLYNVSRIMNFEDLSCDETLQIICEMIPSGMSYSQETHAILSIEGKNYASLYFGESENSITREVKLKKDKMGLLKVYRSSLVDDYRKEAFTHEEQEFITAVVEMVSTYISKVKSEKSLLTNNKTLEKKIELRTAELKETNLLLRNEIEKHVRIRNQLDEMLEKNKKNEIFRLDFLRSLSHEIKTPLNIVNGNAELMEKGVYGDPSGFSEPIKNVKEAVIRATNIVNDLLEISHTQLKDINLEKSKISVLHFRDLFNEYEFLASKRGLDFEVSFSGNETFNGDFQIWNTILSNLISNAVKYTKEGFIRISFDVGDDKIYLNVQDSGEGISAEKMNGIFEISVDEDKNYMNKGFGLPIVKKMVDLVSGNIEIKTGQNGTAVEVTVPIG